MIRVTGCTWDGGILGRGGFHYFKPKAFDFPDTSAIVFTLQPADDSTEVRMHLNDSKNEPFVSFYTAGKVERPVAIIRVLSTDANL